MKGFKLDHDRPVLTWLGRIVSLVAIAAFVAAIVVLVRKRDALYAFMLVATAPLIALMFRRRLTELLFNSLERAKSYVEGAEGGHWHEWYAFKGQRVRVFLDQLQRPWFAANDVAFILGIEDEKSAFLRYGPNEYGTPESASERCISEPGLRRLIKYSLHPDAGALGIWLEREVLRMLRNRKEIAATSRTRRDD